MVESAAAGWRRLAATRWLYCATAAAIAAVALLELLLVPGMTGDAIAPLLVVALCVPVIAAREYPVAAAITEGLVLALSPAVTGDFPSLPLLAPAAVAYGCGAYATLRAGALGVAGLVALTLAASAAAGVPALLATLAPWWTGRQMRRRRELVRDLGARTRELEAEEDAFARLSVQRERARIARELHDIVAHHLAVIVVQAGAGRLASGDQAGERFASIRGAAVDALAELARLVDVLHGDDGAARPRRRLALLLERAEASGLQVEVAQLPRDIVLPPAVEDAAYRVVQEGLTNAIKHAPGSTAAVRLQVAGDSLELEVRNASGALPSSLSDAGAGLGLTGMRERIEELGGQLEAGPEPYGGWLLAASVPLADRALTPAG